MLNDLHIREHHTPRGGGDDAFDDHALAIYRAAVADLDRHNAGHPPRLLRYISTAGGTTLGLHRMRDPE